MGNILETSLAWPAFPFSVLLGLVTLYWLLVIAGALDLSLFDFDLDFDADPGVETSLSDWGMVGIKWFNLGDVPLMVWMSVLAMTSWCIAVYYDPIMTGAAATDIATVVARNLGLGLIAAKLVTQPLKGKLKHKEPNTVEEMIGRTCTVIISEATPKHGNAICQIEDGAPLQLNIRMVEGTAQKDDVVEIVDYSPETGVYYVQLT